MKNSKSTKGVYAYLRVSTANQEDSASLPEQKRIISNYAVKNDLKIIEYFKEIQTASKRGRPVFNRMLEQLLALEAEGVIIHKIDRSARNMHDWASIGELIDNGIDVFFAHENLNLNQRGGRLSADIQAVMAADYSRNLRQETKKGLYGRLEQGIFPFGAPIGYSDTGKGNLKVFHPTNSILVKELFTLYTTGEYNILDLSKLMQKKGLTNRRGNPVNKNGITKILKNPFYTGLMKIKGQTFNGKHKALIDSRTFKQVQMVMSGRKTSKGLKHNYLFRRKIDCTLCGLKLVGEKQKGHIYYRCQTKSCATKCIREDHIQASFKDILSQLSFTEVEFNGLKALLEDRFSQEKQEKEKALKGLLLQKSQIQQKEDRLLDAYMDQIIDKTDFERRKSNLLLQLKELEEKVEGINHSNLGVFHKIEQILELCHNPLKLYDTAILEEKRELAEILTSNLHVDVRKICFTMRTPFYELVNRQELTLCALKRETPRTLTTSQNIEQTLIFETKDSRLPSYPELDEIQLKCLFELLLETSQEFISPILY